MRQPAQARPRRRGSGDTATGSWVFLLVSSESRLEQPLGIAAKNLAAFRLGDIELPDGRDGGRDRPKRGIGCEHHVIAAEEFEPAVQGMDAAAEQRGIAVEI